MFKYFQKLDSNGSGKTTSVAINVNKIISATQAPSPKATVLVLDRGVTVVVEGSQLDIVAQLNIKD